MQPLPPITKRATIALSGLGLLGLLGLSAVTALQHFIAQDKLQRSSADAQLTVNLPRYQQILKEYRAEKGAYPDPDDAAATEPTFTQVAAERGAPPPPANEDYFYNAGADSYVLCAPMAARTGALFVTEAGGFRANDAQCRPDTSPYLASVIAKTGLSSGAASDFLAAQDRFKVVDEAALRESCANSTDASTVLYGCYDPPSDTIYVLNIQQPDFKAEQNVVAVHEFLHQRYGKLSEEERATITALVDVELTRPESSDIQEELEVYDESVQNTEAFSRFATEAANLSPELEKVYSRYFLNRREVVAQHAPYKTIITRLNTLQSQLKRQSARAEALRASGDIAGFNRTVGPYNALVREYNALAERSGLLKQ